MTEARYRDVFGYATDAFLRYVGVDDAYLESGHSAYTVEGHIRYLHEVTALEPLAVETQVLGADGKRVHLFHTLTHGRSGELLATGECMLLHVDTTAGRACEWSETVASGVAAAVSAHAHLSRPDGAGRAIAMPRAG